MFCPGFQICGDPQVLITFACAQSSFKCILWQAWVPDTTTSVQWQVWVPCTSPSVLWQAWVPFSTVACLGMLYITYGCSMASLGTQYI